MAWAVSAALALGVAPARAASAEAVEPSLFQALEYRSIGPFRGGRVVAVAGVPGSGRVFYMGATGGGVWKTTDAGLSWSNVSDGFFGGSIGAIAIAASDTNVIYVGTGEACIRGNVSPGVGVYRSLDAGRTWKHVGLKEAGQIGEIRVHPKDPDLVYVAVLGHAFGPNPERGVYRSQDGGASWERVLYVSDEAGVVDIAMDTINPRVLYAAAWEAVRKPWMLVSGGPGSGLHKSTDGGDTWTPLTKGIPDGVKGRIGVAVSPAKPDRVWALVEAEGETGGLYRSDDAGESFTSVSKDRRLLGRPFYYMHLVADPHDAAKIYSVGHGDGFVRSNDGGETFKRVEGADQLHGDHHALWIDPADAKVMLTGDDGGASVSQDGGVSWTTQANQPTAEIYRVATDNQFLYRLYGSQQDNSSISIPSRTTGRGITWRDWYPVGGGEQGQHAVDPRDPNIAYGGEYEGILERYDHRTGQLRNVLSYPQFGEGVPAKNLKYRFQMNAPVRISAHQPYALYHTSNVVHMSTDEGQSWSVISPDLTRDDKSKQDWSGGPITKDHTGPETYGTIFAFEESPHRPGLLWAGSDDGLVHVSRDAGANWQNVTPKAMPEWGTVNMVDLSAHDPGRAFIAVHRYRDDDFRPYVFRTDDYGETWDLLTSGSNGIPADHFVRVVREDPGRKGLLYAGTEFGMYVSFDDGAAWQPFQNNLPIVPITDMQVKNHDLVISTQGRGFWILDDLTPMQQLDAGIAEAPAHLFQPRDAYRVGGSDRSRPLSGRNPPNGAIIYYSLKTAGAEVELEILDAAGKSVRSFSSKGDEKSRDTLPKKAGLNRFVWNLRYPGAKLVQEALYPDETPGPKAVPAVYQARLTLGDLSQTQSFEVKKDPRLATTAEDFARQFELASTIRDRLQEIHSSVAALRDVRAQVKALAEHADAGKVPADLGPLARAFSEKLSEVEEQLIQPKMRARIDVIDFGPRLDLELVDLLGIVLRPDARPTDGILERFRDLDSWFAKQRERLQRVLDEDLAALNAAARDADVPALVDPRPEA